jgi:hypothetical protein
MESAGFAPAGTSLRPCRRACWPCRPSSPPRPGGSGCSAACHGWAPAPSGRPEPHVAACIIFRLRDTGDGNKYLEFKPGVQGCKHSVETEKAKGSRWSAATHAWCLRTHCQHGPCYPPADLLARGLPDGCAEAGLQLLHQLLELGVQRGCILGTQQGAIYCLDGVVQAAGK